MKVKANVLTISIILAIILFIFSTYMQKKMINYEATISCLVLSKDINANEMVDKEFFKKAEVPISLVATQKIITNFDEIEGLYARDNIKACQIAFKSQFDTRENLSIYEAEEGKEKLSIKIKSAENGMSFQIKEKSRINVYATIRNEYAYGFAEGKERMQIGNEYDGYTIIKILENVEVLGTFSSDGIEIGEADGDNIDSVLISVTPEEAKQINLIREIAVFNITETNISKNKEPIVSESLVQTSGETITNKESGDVQIESFYGGQ